MSKARDRLVLVLDVGGLDQALPLAERLKPWFAFAKVGIELYAEDGRRAFDALHDIGLGVFADLKLYDIPTTVRRAARVHGRHGVDILNIHAAGGVEMLRAGVDGLREGAAEMHHPDPTALGVTVLTSDPDTTAFSERLEWSSAAGCDGVVCAAAEAASAHALDLRAMVPGIRLPGGETHDQARVATPADAIKAGADWLVVGRTVTAAPDPEDAAARVAALVDGALEAR
jgi:orotidine-5'-phosphate decarboxylase